MTNRLTRVTTPDTPEFGWDAGGRSIEPLPEPSGYFKCQIGVDPVGVQVGLCGEYFSHQYSELSHSLVVRHDQLTVVESGLTVFGPVQVAAESVLEVVRSFGAVSYRVNGDPLYTSQVAVTTEVYGGALLYSVDDFVDNPEISVVEGSSGAAQETPSRVYCSDYASLGQEQDLYAVERVAVFGSGNAVRRQPIQYAINYLTGAVATYQNFGFHGFVSLGGQTMAWRPDGLYLLGDETDSGELIQAQVDFGSTDYGNAQVKRLTSAYVGLRGEVDACLYLQADDSPEHEYPLLGMSGQRRAALARGAAGHFWNLRLELTDAKRVTLDRIELDVALSQRRWRG